MQLNKNESYETKRQQIIDGALEVFATKGYDKANNKDIASAAGIRSAGLIYHYFKDKKALHREVLEQRLPILQLLMNSKELEGLPPEETLMRFGRSFLQVLEAPQSVSLLRLMLGGATRNASVADIFWQAGPMRGLSFLEKYFRDAMKRGELRQVDPAFAAMRFMGPLIMYLLSRVVFTNSVMFKIDANAMLEQHISLFLDALRPGTKKSINGEVTK